MANKSIIDMAKDFLAIVRKSRVGTVQPYDMAVILNQATEAVVTDKLKVIEIDKKSYNDLLPLRTTTIIDATTSDEGDLFPNKMFAVPSNFRRDIRLTAKFGTNAPTKTILIKSNEANEANVIPASKILPFEILAPIDIKLKPIRITAVAISHSGKYFPIKFGYL